MKIGIIIVQPLRDPRENIGDPIRSRYARLKRRQISEALVELLHRFQKPRHRFLFQLQISPFSFGEPTEQHTQRCSQIVSRVTARLCPTAPPSAAGPTAPAGVENSR